MRKKLQERLPPSPKRLAGLSPVLSLREEIVETQTKMRKVKGCNGLFTLYQTVALQGLSEATRTQFQSLLCMNFLWSTLYCCIYPTPLCISGFLPVLSSAPTVFSPNPGLIHHLPEVSGILTASLGLHSHALTLLSRVTQLAMSGFPTRTISPRR